MRLNKSFFNYPAPTVAKSLLGKVLVRKIGNKKIEAIITETEAYVGPDDRGSHTYLEPELRNKTDFTKVYTKFEKFVPIEQRTEFKKNLIAKKGKLTPRTLPMFFCGGHSYVYLIYGMYSQFNISTNKAGYPEAVLIRAVKPLFKTEHKTNGPGKLCKFLKIDKKLNAIDLTSSKALWIEDRGIKVSKIKRSRRIGIDYAGKDALRLWRFSLENYRVGELES